MDIQLSQYRDAGDHRHYVRGTCLLPDGKRAVAVQTVTDEFLVSAAVPRVQVFNALRREVCADLISQYFKE